MKDIIEIRQRSAVSHTTQQSLPVKEPSFGHRKGFGWIVSSICIATLGLVSAHAEEVLLDEDFSRSAKGTFLEQSSEFDWQVEKGRLIIGNGRELNGQALGYAPNHTWNYQNYYQDLNATLAPDEAVEVSFSAAVQTDASPEFYIYAMRLNDGSDSVQIQVKGDKEAPRVTIESVLNGKKTQTEIKGVSYYEQSDNAGLVAVRMIVDGNTAQAYYDITGDGDWVAAGEPVACKLATLDRVQLRYYAMGFWSAMDDLKVAIVQSNR
tara:strand:+ start:13731 stop:14525 length:795 start_codon:yes stop_codon:yes gene_type:complete